MTEIIARRQFAPLYIWLDIAFLCVFLALLLMKKKYMTLLVGLVMGLVYMLVDYGIFHLVCHSRSISEGHSLFWVLLWMSMSYGFTNFRTSSFLNGRCSFCAGGSAVRCSCVPLPPAQSLLLYSARPAHITATWR